MDESKPKTENVSLASFFGNNNAEKKVVTVKSLDRTLPKPKSLSKTVVSANPVQTSRKGSRYKGKQIAVPQPELLAKNTLDATHKSRMKHFKEERKSLNSKKKEMQRLNKELTDLNDAPLSDRNFYRIVSVEEAMKKLQKEIDYIESGQGELEYYTKTGELLMEYYEHINSMKKKGRKGSKKKSSGKATAGGKSVYDMFMKPQASASLQSHLASAIAKSDEDMDTHSDTHSVPDEEDLHEESEKEVSVLDCLASLGLATFTAETGAGAGAGAGAEGETGTGDDNSKTPSAPSPPDNSGNSDQKPTINLPNAIKAITSNNDNDDDSNRSTITAKGNKEGENKPLQFLGSLAGFVEKQEVFNRADYFDEYLSIIDPHFVRDETAGNQEPDKDSFCGRCNCYRYMNHSEAMMICPECGSYEAIVIDSDKPNYKDPPVEISNFPYRRINHFNECLSQFQAKESTEIPQIVYDTILMEMKKERITNMADLTRDKVHKYLKKQPNKKFTNYYEHIPHIINRLTGIKPKTMTPKQEDELRTMFHAIQEPYERHKPKNRKNFLNYNYVLHKFCQLKGYVEFLDCFPLLKSKEKLYQQDLVWKKICYELEWVYFPSI